MSEYNPFAAPSVYGDVASENMPRREYGGIGRAAYFGLGILLNVIVQVVQAGGVAVQSPALIYATFPFAIFGGCALAWHRCKNLGMNPWWAWESWYRFLNIFVGIRCLAYPEGYEDHKTLDGAAKVIIGLFLALFLVAVIAIVAAVTLIGR